MLLASSTAEDGIHSLSSTHRKLQRQRYSSLKYESGQNKINSQWTDKQILFWLLYMWISTLGQLISLIDALYHTNNSLIANILQ